MNLLVVTPQNWVKETLTLLVQQLDTEISVQFVYHHADIIPFLANSPTIDCLIVSPLDSNDVHESILTQVQKTHPELPVLKTPHLFNKHLAAHLLLLDKAGFLRKPIKQFSSSKDHPIENTDNTLTPSLTHPYDHKTLTPRQAEVLRKMKKGLSNKEIAMELTLSEETVKSHVIAILRHLDVKNRTQAVLIATTLGY